MNETAEATKEKLKRRVEKETTAYWNEYGHNMVIHAAKTDVVIAPKPLLGEVVNPEITKHLLQTILSHVSAKEIMEEKIIITPETTQFFSSERECLATVPSQPILQKVSNKLSNRIGSELAQQENMWGERYVIPKDSGRYTFQEILDPMVRFIRDQGFERIENPFKEFIQFLRKERQTNGNA